MSVSFIEEALQKIEHQGLMRSRKTVMTRRDNACVVDGMECINFTSNDYLGLATSPAVIDAVQRGIAEYGFGSSSSPQISGYTDWQKELEETFASLLGRSAALYFNSGYAANVGVAPSIISRYQTIFSDRLCHASILDGIQLSRAHHVRFRHQDLDHLESLLKQQEKQSFVVTESVFSMEGDITPVKDIAALCQQYNATLFVDDAHGFGVLGETGLGVCEAFHCDETDIPLLITPLGKGAGGMGAFVSGTKDMVEMVLQKARSYRYSTALPPAFAAGMIKALSLIKNETWRHQRLLDNIDYFIKTAHDCGLGLYDDARTPIFIIPIGDNQKVMHMQESLLNAGFWVSAIRPPTVPENTARLRLSINCNHEKDEIKAMLEMIRRLSD